MSAVPYQVIHDEYTYTVVDDLVSRYQLLVAGRVFAEPFGMPLERFNVGVDHPGVQARRLGDGFFCLAGNVGQVFPDIYGTPGTSYSLNVDIHAERYQPASVQINFPASSSLPLAQLDVNLAYLPLRLAGRVELMVNNDPVPGAVLAMGEPDLLLARTPLHFTQPSGTAIQEVAFTPAGAARALVAEFMAGASALSLNNAAGIPAGTVLQVGPPERYEYLIVDGPGGTPGVLLVSGSAQRSYPPGTVVQPVNVAPGLGNSTLAGEVETGAALLRLNSSLNADFVQIGTPPTREYQAISALANADGYYAVDGIAGVVTLSIRVTNPAGPEFADTLWRISPGQPVNIVNFRLSI